jgi:hypothetical protein
MKMTTMQQIEFISIEAARLGMKYGEYVEKYGHTLPKPDGEQPSEKRRQCAVCGKFFTIRRGNAKYCNACALEGKKMKEQERKERIAGKELPSMITHCKRCGVKLDDRHGNSVLCPTCRRDQNTEYYREYRKRKREEMKNGKGNKAGNI